MYTWWYPTVPEGNIASITAVALGAVAIEKHFTISRKLPGIEWLSAASTGSQFCVALLHRLVPPPRHQRILVPPMLHAQCVRGPPPQIMTLCFESRFVWD